MFKMTLSKVLLFDRNTACLSGLQIKLLNVAPLHIQCEYLQFGMFRFDASLLQRIFIIDGKTCKFFDFRYCHI